MLGNRYVAIAVGIILTLVIAYNVQFFLGRNKPPVPQEPVYRQAATKQRPAAQQALAKTEESVKPSSHLDDKTDWKRDPFSLRKKEPPKKQEEPALEINLTAIIKREGNSLALIDGKVYGVNDRIGTAVITDIHRHSIVVSAGGKKQEITFNDYKVIKENKK